MMESTGILILAYHHEFYLKSAYLLRQTVPIDIPVHLVVGSSIINYDTIKLLKMFEDSEISTSIMIDDFSTMSTYEPKMYVDMLSPFERTVYIDADALFTGSFSKLWAEYVSTPYITVNGFTDLITGQYTGGGFKYTNFAKSNKELYEYLCQYNTIYDIIKFYHTSSGFMIFDKSNECSKFFNLGRKIFYDHNAPVRHIPGRGIADEFAFNCAASILYPPSADQLKANWKQMPTHFHATCPEEHIFDLESKYVAVQLGGDSLPAYIHSYISWKISQCKMLSAYFPGEKKQSIKRMTF